MRRNCQGGMRFQLKPSQAVEERDREADDHYWIDGPCARPLELLVAGSRSEAADGSGCFEKANAAGRGNFGDCDEQEREGRPER
jgi:hypothetical protein